MRKKPIVMGIINTNILSEYKTEYYKYRFSENCRAHKYKNGKNNLTKYFSTQIKKNYSLDLIPLSALKIYIYAFRKYY